MNRLARSKLFNYGGGQSIVRRAATASVSTTLLVNSLAGLRSAPNANGTLSPVSSANPLAITIVAATTFTASVTAATPIDA
ncbi:hypothetical protein ACKI10_46445, partial [Streptomyces galilaeus]|uniref:hypothetical protein n=1 Tax=Streptomyces galilaeus TaxID=33899 RepID=UPI0038F6747A